MSSMIAAAILLFAAHPGPAATASAQASSPPSERTDLGDGLHMLAGRGGNMLFSVGTDGTFVVDDQFADVAPANLAQIKAVSDTPVIFVLNTHFHGDHTGGNAAFFKAGATIVAHDNVRKRLAAQTGDRAVGAEALPVITFSQSTTFHWNGEELRVIHLPTAHTDGDAIVHLPDVNLIHTGDLLFAGRYPFIDLDGGGSVSGYLDALKAIKDLANAQTRIVPGHGPLASVADVDAMIAMITNARAAVKAEMMAGKGRDAVIAANPLKAYNEAYSWAFISGDRFAGTLFDDLLRTDGAARAAAERGGAR